jgi:hypothetical protein
MQYSVRVRYVKFGSHTFDELHFAVAILQLSY